MNTPFHLTDKTFLVTGSSSGIGRQIAISITEMGGKVIITGRDENRLEETFQSLQGEGHKKIIADLNSDDQRKDLVTALPVLNGVVHCAGFVSPYPIKFINDKKMKETFQVNYESPVLLMAGITKSQKLNKGASIVFLSSIAASHPHKGGTLYAGSKAALESFSKVLALEFYDMQIRSNCIAPAMVKTPLYEYSEQNASKETMDAHVSKYPLGVGETKDVANAAIFLLSDASRWITGTTLTLDGGFLLGGI